MLTCSRCGREVSPSQKFCSGCGGPAVVRAGGGAKHSTALIVVIPIVLAVTGFLALVGFGVVLGYRAAKSSGTAHRLSTLAQSFAELRQVIPPLPDGTSSGYVFTLAVTPDGWAMTAVPDETNRLAQRTFYTDQTMVIRAEEGLRPAGERSPEYK
jgi:hypothetical protein